MSNEELFQQCMEAGARIVTAEREAYSGADMQALDFSVSGGTTDSSFQRLGTSEQSKQYALPSNLASLIEQGYLNAGVPSATNQGELNFLNQMLALVPELLPGLSVLTDAQGLTPGTFTGSDTLTNVAQRDPYSAQYEQETQGLYERTMDIGRARAASGPENVRGGQARAGCDLADTNTQAGLNRFKEINANQQQESGVVSDAIKTANAIEQARRGTQMQGQNQQVSQELARRGQKFNVSDSLTKLRANSLGQNALGTEFLGSPKVSTSDNLRGKGNQSTFNWGAGGGISCCFIFLAVSGGCLPWWVRYCRNVLGTDQTRLGYRRMARWLVPLMDRWGWVRALTDALMVHPLTCYGGYLLRQPGYEAGFVFRPVKAFWFWVWEKTAKE